MRETNPLSFGGRPSLRGLMRNWHRLALISRRLLSARFWRSISQGALVVDLSLFLHALGWQGVYDLLYQRVFGPLEKKPRLIGTSETAR